MTGGEKIFYCIAPISAAFSAWAYVEMKQTAAVVEPKPKTGKGA
jgi:hypothetical protein